MNTFHVQGAVPISSESYISRAFEDQVTAAIFAGRYVLVLGPNQHGKSSGLLRVRRNLTENGIECPSVDLQGLPRASTYQELLQLVCHSLARSVGWDYAEPDGLDVSFLESWLDLLLPANDSPVVVFIDEASRISDESQRNSFYGQIRAIANKRADSARSSIAARIRFVFSGTFQPETLVDEINSPFNVCDRVETEDISLAEAKTLAALGSGRATQVVEEIYELVGGHPYLLQRAFLFVEESSLDVMEALQSLFSRFREGSDMFFERLFGTVLSSEALLSIAAELVTAGSIRNVPANPDYRYAVVLGFAARHDGRLSFRSPLLAELTAHSPQVVGGGTREAGRLYVLDIDRFNFIQDPDSKVVTHQFYRSGVILYNAKSYRVALAAFGAALEGMLQDWLPHVSGADLAGAITSSGVSFGRFEDRADPKTWNLSTCCKVARKVCGGNVVIDPPEALREWRNSIHPQVALRQRVDEAELEPEALAANALLTVLMRDLTDLATP